MKQGSALLERLGSWPVGRMVLAGAILGAGMGGVLLAGLEGVWGLLACGLLLLAAVSLGLYRPLHESLEEAPTTAIEPLLEMVDIPAGEFLMGSPEGAQPARPKERPQHRVRISAFQASAAPVTRGLYREIMDSVPAQWPETDDEEEAALPANYVSWFDAVEFCNRLSARSGLQRCYEVEGRQVGWNRTANGYRLPSEAEWEYAARAGSNSTWFFGDDQENIKEYAWFVGNSDGKPHPVVQLKPNPWGLFDVYGNVWEWCFDVYSPYEDIVASIDPVVEDTRGSADFRVLRGGSWGSGPEDVRSAIRLRNWPRLRNVRIGFRCVHGPRRQP